jgi:hypothetical protein
MCQEARSIRLERERADEIERRLTARVTEAEDSARHADVKAKLSFERWKAEASLALEERERALERAERRARDEVQVSGSIEWLRGTFTSMHTHTLTHHRHPPSHLSNKISSFFAGCGI